MGEGCDDENDVTGDGCSSSCRRVVEVASDHFGGHTCVLLDYGSIKCWGKNEYGQLGLGDIEYRGDGSDEMGDSLPTVMLGTGRYGKAVAAGGYHTCALLDDDSVKCWGRNDSGQLGLGNTSHRGDAAGEMGDALPAVSLGTGRTAKAVAVGGNHTCALLDDDSVKCWGANSYGVLGQGDTDARGDASGEMGDILPVVSLGTGRTATRIAAGIGHTCALLDDESIKCWGRNLEGELGLGDTDARGDGSNEMGDLLPAVSLGSAGTAKALAAGEQHSCALLIDDTVKCRGAGTYGQLGLGDTDGRGDSAGEMGDALPTLLLP